MTSYKENELHTDTPGNFALSDQGAVHGVHDKFLQVPEFFAVLQHQILDLSMSCGIDLYRFLKKLDLLISGSMKYHGFARG